MSFHSSTLNSTSTIRKSSHVGGKNHIRHHGFLTSHPRTLFPKKRELQLVWRIVFYLHPTDMTSIMLWNPFLPFWSGINTQLDSSCMLFIKQPITSAFHHLTFHRGYRTTGQHTTFPTLRNTNTSSTSIIGRHPSNIFPALDHATTSNEHLAPVAFTSSCL